MKPMMYFAAGMITAGALFMLTGAISDRRLASPEVGRYQIDSTAEENHSSVWVVDTVTGSVKLVAQSSAEELDDPQYGKPFIDIRDIED